MKKLIGTVVFAAALVYGAVAQAAAINIIATEQADQATWILSVDTTLPVAAIGIIAPSTATFAVNTANTQIAGIGAGSSYGVGATDGFFSLNLNPVNCAPVSGVTVCTPFINSGQGVLGTFVAAGNLSSLIGPDDDSVGGTVFDVNLNPYDPSQFAIVNVNYVPPVPEPGVAMLLGVGLAALGLVRRKVA